MAFKAVNEANLEFAPENPKENRGLLREAGEFGRSLLSSAISGPLSVAEIPLQGLKRSIERGTNTPLNVKFPSQAIPEAILGKAEQPEHLVSKALHTTAANWPFLFAGGVPSLGAVGADIASSLGLESAKEMGFGPIGQIAASSLSSAGFKNLSKKIGKNFPEPSKIEKFTSDLYDKEKTLGSKIKVESGPITKKLNDLYDSISNRFVDPRKFSESDKSRLLSNIRNASERVDKGNLTASDIFDIKKSLNEIYISPKSVEGREFNKLRSIFTDELNQLSKSKLKRNQNWSKAWRNADELYSIGKWQTGLSRKLQDLEGAGKLGKIISNPITYGVLYGMQSIPSGTVGTLATGAGILGGGLKGGNALAEQGVRATRYLNSLRQTPEGQKILWDIVADSAKDTSESLIKSISKLDRKVKDLENNPQWKTVDASNLQFAD